MNDLEHIRASFELKRAPDEGGVFEGYASVFDIVDLGRDVVAPGAFTKSLGERKVKMLWQHEQDKPIGVWQEVREDQKGLYVRGQFNMDVQLGREAHALVKQGAVDGLSIGYNTIDSEPDASSRNVRRLKQVALHEISVVTFAMLPPAKITAIKSIRTIRDFEKALRDVGFSQSEAKAIAAEGFKGLADHRDDVEAEPQDECLKALISQLGHLKETLNVR